MASRGAAYAARYRQLHPERVKACVKKYRDGQRQLILRFLGGKCVKCSNSDWRVLQVDHLNGGGNRHRREAGCRQVWKDAMENPQNYQLLCANCNWIKRYEENECSPDAEPLEILAPPQLVLFNG